MRQTHWFSFSFLLSLSLFLFCFEYLLSLFHPCPQPSLLRVTRPGTSTPSFPLLFPSSRPSLFSSFPPPSTHKRSCLSDSNFKLFFFFFSFLIYFFFFFYTTWNFCLPDISYSLKFHAHDPYMNPSTGRQIIRYTHLHTYIHTYIHTYSSSHDIIHFP